MEGWERVGTTPLSAPSPWVRAAGDDRWTRAPACERNDEEGLCAARRSLCRRIQAATKRKLATTQKKDESKPVCILSF